MHFTIHLCKKKIIIGKTNILDKSKNIQYIFFNILISGVIFSVWKQLYIWYIFV